MKTFSWIRGGGVTSAKGYRSAGVSAGIKKGGKKDMAMIVSDSDAVLAATFTTNRVKAAPVKVSMSYARNGAVRGVVMNSGNANACTGVRGLTDARRMADLACQLLKFKKRQMLVCSTGHIGTPLPMNKIETGIRQLIPNLGETNGSLTAEAMMTTDTRPKECAVRMKIDGEIITIGGAAKGAGMIHPNMATMLAFITTDARIDKKTFQRLVHDAVEQTFNRISVDGDTSTNDTVLAFANGLAGNNPLKSYHPQLETFKAGLHAVLQKLARMIVEDGEGITKVVEIIVRGASHSADAKLIANAVAKSPLVKCAWNGGDPGWGRVMAAMGYSGARVREEMVEIYYDGAVAVRHGLAGNTPETQLRKITKKKTFTLTIDLHSGKGQHNLLTNDFSEEYVRINHH